MDGIILRPHSRPKRTSMLVPFFSQNDFFQRDVQILKIKKNGVIFQA